MFGFVQSASVMALNITHTCIDNILKTTNEYLFCLNH